MVVLSHWLIGPSFIEGQVVGASTYTCSSCMVPLKFLGLLNPFAVRGLVSPLALFWELNLTTGCVAADTSVLGSICERAPLVWVAVWTCSVYW